MNAIAKIDSYVEIDAARREVGTDPLVVMLIPDQDVIAPKLSIVVPAMNEEITIGHFIDWCHEGIANLDIPVEIIIVDSSSDRTPEIALAKGARVLKTPKRGLGRAYIDCIPFIRGDFIIMGDADCTYDFRELRQFVQAWRDGAEFVMGSRFKGSIEDGAMPPLHRYFGTPLTTFILNVMYGTKFSDIHCGMRGLTKDALHRIDLSSQSWEYASEMVLKSVHADLRQAEVPVRFLKDMDGRESHMIRAGFWGPWEAGWINLRAMFVFGADFFLTRPGALMFWLGSALVLGLAFGPVEIGSITLSLNSMVIGFIASVIGLNMWLAGGLARCIYDSTGRTRTLWLKRLPYNRTILTGLGAFALGFVLLCGFLVDFTKADFVYTSDLVIPNHHAIAGLYLMVSSMMAFVMMLIMHALGLYLRNTRQPTPVSGT